VYLSDFMVFDKTLSTDEIADLYGEEVSAGGWSYDLSNYFNGNLSKLSFYNTNLSSDQISALATEATQPSDSFDISENMSGSLSKLTFYERTLTSAEIGALYNETAAGSNCNAMFRGAASFNQDISGWNVSNVTNVTEMFRNASAFNQALTWTFSNVSDFSGMFSGATAFDSAVTGWTFGTITNTSNMFAYTSFNQDISGWNMSAVTDANGMFLQNTAFNQPIGGWNVGALTDAHDMFRGATAFNADISGWDVSNVTNFSWMLGGATAFTYNIGGWDFTSASNMTYMITNVNYDETVYSSFLTDLSANATLPNSQSLAQTGLFSNQAVATTAARTYLTGTKSLTLVDNKYYKGFVADDDNITVLTLTTTGSSATTTSQYTYISDKTGLVSESDVGGTFDYTVSYTSGLTLDVTYSLGSGDTLTIKEDNDAGATVATYTNASSSASGIDISGYATLFFKLETDSNYNGTHFNALLTRSAETRNDFIYTIHKDLFSEGNDLTNIVNTNSTYTKVSYAYEEYSEDASFNQVTVSFLRNSDNVTDGIHMPEDGNSDDYSILAFGTATLSPECFRNYKGAIDVSAGSPTILSGTTFASMFRDATTTNFGSIGS
jgi:surface protein